MIVGAASALAAIVAAVAAVRSANIARESAAQAARQTTAALLHELSQSVTAVISRGERIAHLVIALKVAMQSQFALANRSVSGAAPHLERYANAGNSAAQMVTEARAVELRDFENLPETELHLLARNMASYAASLAIHERGLTEELTRLEAENRAARARR
jgi:uncharacterized membrane protein YhfC